MRIQEAELPRHMNFLIKECPTEEVVDLIWYGAIKTNTH